MSAGCTASERTNQRTSRPYRMEWRVPIGRKRRGMHLVHSSIQFKARKLHTTASYIGEPVGSTDAIFFSFRNAKKAAGLVVGGLVGLNCLAGGRWRYYFQPDNNFYKTKKFYSIPMPFVVFVFCFVFCLLGGL